MILLSDIWQIDNLTSYKIHFAKWNQKEEPLEAFVRSFSEWQGWQEYRPNKNDFNRPFIFSLARFYHEPDAWLFGGVFRVVARHNTRYEVSLDNATENLIGRLKIRYSHLDRAVRVNLENHYNKFEVQEIFAERYSGREFPGYEGIDLNFVELETLVKNSRLDWKSALEHTKGIYLITDASTGKKYVGSAYGDEGIWSRWRSYVTTGHGGNVELKKVIGSRGLDYCRENFRFALLEHRPNRTIDKVIFEREGFWKDILLARGKHGLSRN